MRETKIKDQNIRRAHESICEVNIGKNTNNGPVIPAEASVRSLSGVIGNNPGYTALSDEEIQTFSLVNKDAIVPSSNENPTFYCQLVLHGTFSLNTMCYAVMKACRATVIFGAEENVISTGYFTALHSITRLLTRAKDDGLTSVEIYKVDTDFRRIKITETTDLNVAQNCLKICSSDSNRPSPERTSRVSDAGDETRDEAERLKEVIESQNQKIEALEEKLAELQEELQEKDEILISIRNLVER